MVGQQAQTGSKECNSIARTEKERGCYNDDDDDDDVDDDDNNDDDNDDDDNNNDDDDNDDDDDDDNDYDDIARQLLVGGLQSHRLSQSFKQSL